MAANSRLSKLGDSDEGVFTFRLFAGWDYTIGNMEAAQNKVASINMGFREALLEAREADREVKSWKLTARRLCAHFLIVCLLLGSAYAVVLLVERSNEVDASSSWWRQNELTVILTLISIIYPNCFELVGLIEKRHPRKQLQWQLGRIMSLNLLNLYTLIFALFRKVDSMSSDLSQFKTELEDPHFLENFLVQKPSTQSVYPEINSTLSVVAALSAVTLASLNVTTGSPVDLETSATNSDELYATEEARRLSNFLFELDSGCREMKIPIPCTHKNKTINKDTNFNTTEQTETSSSVNFSSPFYNSENDTTTSIKINNSDFINIFDSTEKQINVSNFTNTIIFTEELKSTTQMPDISGLVPGILRPFAHFYWVLPEKNSSYPKHQRSSHLNGRKLLLFNESFYEPDYPEKHNFTEFTLNSDVSLDLSNTSFLEELQNVSSTTSSKLSITEKINEIVDSTTIINDFNTDQYPNYANYIDDSHDCFEIIQVCNETINGTTALNNSLSQRNDSNLSVLKMPNLTNTQVPRISPEKLAKNLPYQNRTKLRKLCWETMFGQEIIKLTVMDLVLTVLTIVIGDYIRAVIVRLWNNCCWWDLEKQFPGYPDFKIAENILHLVNNQGLVWMGMFFSPGLPVLNLVKLLILLYVRSWAVITSNVPPETVFKASDNNNFYLALLLVMLFLCTLPVGYAVVWVTPSWHCGPFSDFGKIYQLATEALINSLPNWCEPIIDYISSPGTVIPAGLLLILIIYYLMSLTTALREAVQDLKDQLTAERNAEKKKAKEAKVNADNETPSRKWSRLLQFTPTLQRKASKNKSWPGHHDDKSPLIENEQKVDSVIPDDLTDQGQSEVFDESVTDSKRGISIKPEKKIINGKQEKEKSDRRKLKESETRRRSSKDSHRSGSKSPPKKHKKKYSYTEDEVFYPEIDNTIQRERAMSKENIKQRRGSLVKYSAKDMKLDSHRKFLKDSPKKSKHQSYEIIERKDSGPKVTQPNEIKRLSEEYPELEDVLLPKVVKAKSFAKSHDLTKAEQIERNTLKELRKEYKEINVSSNEMQNIGAGENLKQKDTIPLIKVGK